MQFLRDFLNDGPKRIEARDKWVGENVMPFVPPELRQWLTVGDAINPVSDMRRAGEKARVVANPDRTTPERIGALGDVLVDSASVLAPAAAAKYSGKAAQGVVDSLAMASMPADDAAQRFMADQSGAFAGVRAKTSDLGALERAEDMTASGASRDDIWRDTGWFQGVDGMWRFEIDDSASRLRARTDEVALKKRPDLGASFQHQELFDAYPQLSELGLRPDYARASEVRGTYRGDENLVTISPFTLRDRGQARSTILHELQHGVQDIEGFSRGGNVRVGREVANDDLWGLAFKAQSKLDETVAALPPEYKRQWEMYLELGGDRRFNMEDRMMSNEVLAPVLELEWETRRLGEMAQSGVDADAAFEAYRRLAGETEARNVQRRQDFGPSARPAAPPWATQDVPDERQIVRVGDALRESAPDRLKNYLNQ